MSVTRQSLAQKFREQKNAVLPPLPPFTDMKYEMRVQNDRWLAIKWSGNNREHWTIILNAIKALPERRYNGATKEWIIPFRDNYLQWANVAGFPDPAIIAEQVQEFTEEEWEDPIESQKKLIADTQIDPERLMLPGLRPYQTDFVKYMIARKGRALLGDEMGCIDGDEEVQICRHRGSQKIPLKKLFSEFHKPMNKRKCYTNEERPWYIRCLHEDGAIRLGEIADVVDSGMKECVCITLSDGRSLTLTPDHMIKTTDGWVQAGSSEGKFVLTNGVACCPVCGSQDDLVTYEYSKFKGYCRPCMYKARNGRKYKDDALHEEIHSDGYVYVYGRPVHGYDGCRRTDGIPKHRYVMEQFLGRKLLSTEIVHHIDGNKLNNDIQNLQLLSVKQHSKIHGDYFRVPFVKPKEVLVEHVEHVGVRHVYDVKVVDHGNFLANKIIVHNCGKTISALAWLVYSDSYPALIVVNAPTKLQWYQQYRDWLKKVPGADYRCQILSGQKPYKLDPNVSCIINWDILHHWKDALAQFGFKYLVGDEVQAIGNPESKRAIAFRMLSKVIPECVCMSGTPARSKPAQFWTVLNIMMPADFPNYYKYLYRYCEPKSTPWGMQFNGASHVQELHYKMSQCLLRRTKEEVMKWLPPKTMEVVPLEIDKTLENEYRDQEAEIYKEGTSDLHQRVADLMRTAYALKEKSLLRWVGDFLDSGNKLLLFAWHRDVVDLLVESLKKYHPVKIYGGISVASREAAKTTFIQDDRCRIMVANIQAGGVGIDGLQKVCNHVAFAEFSHTPLDHRQAEDRLHRGGQDLPVTSYYLIAPGTVDDDSVEVLDDRAQMLDNALDGHKTADVNLIGEILERKGIKL